MAKVFAIRTEPNSVMLGATEVFFLPEADGTEFIEHYAVLSAAQKAADPDDEAAAAVAVLAAMKEFIAKFLMPDSVLVFWSLKLPSRVVMEMVEHLAELYGGGSEERPTGQSNGSAKRRPSPGKRG